MSITQNTYTENIAAAIEGQIADMTNCDVRTYRVSGDDAIKFGYPVIAVADTDECVPVTHGVAWTANTLPLILGIAIKDITRDPSDEDEYVKPAHVNVLVRGTIWVKVEAAITDAMVRTRQVSFKRPAAADDATGQFSGGATAPAQPRVAGARWVTKQATAGGLAKLELAGGISLAIA